MVTFRRLYEGLILVDQHISILRSVALLLAIIW